MSRTFANALLFLAAMIGSSAAQQIDPAAPKDASELTRALNRAQLEKLPFADAQDFDFASRGFIATRDDKQIKTEDGRVAWDLGAYDWVTGDAPATINPGLWRQAQLNAKHGLFKVADGIYQVRGFDISNITIIEGASGYIVIDPLTSTEVAKAAFDLVRQHVADKPIHAVIYTHSHADHYAGVRGIIEQERVDRGDVKIIAPEGFLEHAVSENVIAGNAMGRRALYQFGIPLPKGPMAQVTSGLGQTISAGTRSFIAPTQSIAKTGDQITIDGVDLVFQLTPGTEAPAEMNIYLPQKRALCLAENANATMHNVLTPRGALVRDAKAWAAYLSEALRLYGDKSDVAFGSHNWPRFGNDIIRHYIKHQRDAYKFLHDQSVRLMNQGLTGPEIAEKLVLPDTLAKEWFNRPFYGSYKFNSKAVYQRYMGWYDGNPANLDPLPPEDAAKKYVQAMGGPRAVMTKARAANRRGEYRWSAEILNHLVFSDPNNLAAKNLLADTFEQLAYQSENGPWRNMYLTGAQELRTKVVERPSGIEGGLEIIRNMPTMLLLDFLAVRLNSDRAAGKIITVDLVFSDRNERHRVTVENSVLTHETEVSAPAAQATLTTTRATFLQIAFGLAALPAKVTAGEAQVDGDVAAFGDLFGLFDAFNPNFPIVTP
jgi:alkyl sulfatase BDS1-like metallo-beta-lactamase superfamily hydrolase